MANISVWEKALWSLGILGILGLGWRLVPLGSKSTSGPKLPGLAGSAIRPGKLDGPVAGSVPWCHSIVPWCSGAWGSVGAEAALFPSGAVLGSFLILQLFQRQTDFTRTPGSLTCFYPYPSILIAKLLRLDTIKLQQQVYGGTVRNSASSQIVESNHHFVLNCCQAASVLSETYTDSVNLQEDFIARQDLD